MPEVQAVITWTLIMILSGNGSFVTIERIADSKSCWEAAEAFSKSYQIRQAWCLPTKDPVWPVDPRTLPVERP